MNKAHPLEIPEILARVGRHVPLWVYSPPLTSTNDISTPTTTISTMGPPYFDPRHLLACIQVNRTWHDIFLPILCFSFDDTAVPTSTTSTSTSTSTTGMGTGTTLPPAVRLFLRHSQRFRLLVLTRPCAPILALTPPQLPIHLLHLELVGLDDDTPTTNVTPPSPSHSSSSWNDWSKTLILQNTRLQSLRWQGGDFHRDNHGVLDSWALAEKLHRLQDLVLECWRLDVGFLELLRRNPELRTLALDFVTGEALPQPLTMLLQGRGGGQGQGMLPSSTTSSSPMKTATTTAAGYPAEWDYPYSHHHHNSNSSSDNDSYPYANPNPYEFQLLHLTSLSVCKDVESGAFEALIRLCPNLEELSWMGPHDSDLQSLTMNLLQCCPRVSVLTYSTVETSEPESVYAGLLNSIPSLVDLQIRIPTLEGGEFTRALLRHAGTLEILDLRIVNHSGPSAASSTVQASTTEEEGSESIGGGGGSKTQENLRRILMGCSELTALSIEGAEGMSESLFMFTWACSQRLHRLFLAAALHALSGGGGVGGVGGMMVAADEDQDEHHSEGLLGTDGGEGEDEFVAEAALHGWTVVSSSGPSRRYRRREGSTSSSASGLDGDNGDLEEESVDTGTGSSFAESTLGSSIGPSSSSSSASISSSSSSSNTDLLGETGHLQQGSGTTTTTTTATDNSGAIILNGPLFLTMNHNGNDEEEDAIIATTTAYPTPAPATTAAVDVAFRSSSSSQSFFRDMMHRLGDMPRLQSFVLNGVEYSRMPGMISC